MKPFVIGLCVLGRPKTTHRVLEALGKHTDRNMYNLVVISQNASKEVVDPVLEFAPDVLCINEWNTGVVFGQNQAMTYRQPGQHYIKIDDDCIILRPGWLDIFQKVLENPTVGSALGRRPTFWIDSPDRKGYFNSYSVTPREINGIWTEDSNGVGLVASWWCMKGEVLDKIGPFNEATSTDDVDWGIRALAEGYKSLWVPDVVIMQPQEEKQDHPQSWATKIMVSINWKKALEYAIRCKKEKIVIGSRFTGFKGCSKEYIEASERNWTRFENYKDENFETIEVPPTL